MKFSLITIYGSNILSDKCVSDNPVDVKVTRGGRGTLVGVAPAPGTPVGVQVVVELGVGDVHVGQHVHQTFFI